MSSPLKLKLPKAFWAWLGQCGALCTRGRSDHFQSSIVISGTQRVRSGLIWVVAGLEERVGEPQRYLTEVRKQKPDSDPKLSSLFALYVCLVAQSCPTLCDPRDCSPPGSSVHGDSPGRNTGVGCLDLLQVYLLFIQHIFECSRSVQLGARRWGYQRRSPGRFHRYHALARITGANARPRVRPASPQVPAQLSRASPTLICSL